MIPGPPGNISYFKIPIKGSRYGHGSTGPAASRRQCRTGTGRFCAAVVHKHQDIYRKYASELYHLDIWTERSEVVELHGVSPSM